VNGEAVAADDARSVAWVRRRLLADYQLTEGTLEVIEKAFAEHERR
jgi:hypothetical protein